MRNTVAALVALGVAMALPWEATAQDSRQLKMGTFSAANSPCM